jgi:hypothetical protein
MASKHAGSCVSALLLYLQTLIHPTLLAFTLWDMYTIHICEYVSVQVQVTTQQEQLQRAALYKQRMRGLEATLAAAEAAGVQYERKKGPVYFPKSISSCSRLIINLYLAIAAVDVCSNLDVGTEYKEGHVAVLSARRKLVLIQACTQAHTHTCLRQDKVKTCSFEVNVLLTR